MTPAAAKVLKLRYMRPRTRVRIWDNPVQFRSKTLRTPRLAAFSNAFAAPKTAATLRDHVAHANLSFREHSKRRLKTSAPRPHERDLIHDHRRSVDRNGTMHRDFS